MDIGKTVPSLKGFLIEPFNKEKCIINNVVVELRTQVVDGTVFVIVGNDVTNKIVRIKYKVVGFSTFFCVYKLIRRKR